MAATIIGVNDAQATRAWAKKLIIESLKETLTDKFVGKDDDSMIQVRDELKQGGQRITIGLRRRLTGKGTLGDAKAKDNAESLNIRNFSFDINQLRHNVNVTGLMSQQRVTWNMRSEANSALKDWWSDRIDVGNINQLCGNTAQTDLEYTGLNAATAPSSTRWIYGGDASVESGLTDASYGFTLQMIDKMVTKARTASPAIRPIMVGGMKVYVLLLHPFQAYQLRTSMTEGNWAQIQQAALKGGLITKNPMFTGALGMWNGTLIFEDARMCFGDSDQANAEYHTDLGAASSSTTNIARAVFCGAQALAWGIGRAETSPERMRWVEELDDGENSLTTYAGMIYGACKTRFDDVDFGTIVASTYSPAV